MNSKRILITGSTGFVGYHTVDWLLRHTDWEIVGMDSFRHAGDSLRYIGNARYKVLCHDFNSPVGVRMRSEVGPIDYIINLASNSNVDESISDPLCVWENNTRLIGNILSFALWLKCKVFIQCSTDEVFGPASEGQFHKEWDVICPSNPYAASKAAQEALCIAYWRTYKLPVIITNCMNMIGERQEPTKYVPKIIRSIFKGETLIVHGSEGNIGSRMYLDAINLADAWLFLLRHHEPEQYIDGPDSQRPSRFNIVGQREVSNLELAQMVAKLMNLPFHYKLEDFHSVRPGHDRRYALDGFKIAKLGWKHPIPFEETLERIINWTMKNPLWL